MGWAGISGRVEGCWGMLELRGFLSEFGGETLWQVAGFRIGVEMPSRDLRQDLCTAPGVGPVEGGDSIFPVAVSCPAVTPAGAGEVDSWLKPGLGIFHRRPEGKEMKAKGGGAQAEPCGSLALRGNT